MPKYYSNRFGQPTIVLSATTPNDKYYGEFFDDIVDFQITFAESVLKRDNVLVIVPEKYSESYLEHLPADVLLYQTIPDIWMRDFTTVLFRYKPNYMSKSDADYIQGKFHKMLKNILPTQLYPKSTSLILDGGNVVDNLKDKAIVMDRVCTDNPKYGREEIRQKLKDQLGYKHIAFIPDDGSRCGHADGVCQFVDEDVVMISCGFGGAVDKKMQRTIEDELFAQFGESVQVVYIKSKFTDDTRWRQFDSAAGLHVNMAVTDNYIYVPVFGHDRHNVGQSLELDEKVLNQLADNSRKKVVPIEVDNKICRMGGSVRCLSWQTVGSLADELINRARTDARRVDPDNFENAVEW